MEATLIIAALFFSVWLFTVIEFIGMHSFKYWLFGLGPVVLRKMIEFPSIGINVTPSTTIKRETGKYRFRDGDRVYFLGKLELFEFKIRTPFAFKFTGTVDAPGRLQVTGRLPLGSLLFFILGLLMWIVAGVTILPGTLSSNAFVLLIFGVFFFAGMFWISYVIERGRNKLMFLELEQILTELNFLEDRRK